MGQRTVNPDIRELWLTMESMKWPTLKGIVSWMENHNYSGYFLGRRWLLPLTGVFWHDAYEVCRAPHSYIYRGLGPLYNGWCWHDIVFLDTTKPIAAKLRRQLVPWHLTSDASSK